MRWLHTCPQEPCAQVLRKLPGTTPGCECVLVRMQRLCSTRVCPCELCIAGEPYLSQLASCKQHLCCTILSGPGAPCSHARSSADRHECRAVAGAADAGKSTLVAVLTQGSKGRPHLDDGQGAARMAVFRCAASLSSRASHCAVPYTPQTSQTIEVRCALDADA